MKNIIIHEEENNILYLNENIPKSTTDILYAREIITSGSKGSI